MQPKELTTARKSGLGLTLREMTWIGKVFYKSGMFSDTSDEAKAIVKIMAGQEMGLAPFEAMTGINIIKGRPTLSAFTIAAKVKSHPKYDYRVKVSTELKNQIDFYELEDGKRTAIGSSTYTIEQAEKAGLLNKDNWRTYPEDMLFARNISRGARRFTPDVFSAPVYVEDELEDAPGGLMYIPIEGGSQSLVAENPVQEPPEADDSDELDDSIIEDETPNETAENVPPIEIVGTVVDDDFKAETLSDIASLDLSDIEEKRLLKYATGKITTKNLSDAAWRTLRETVTERKNEMESDTEDIET